MMMNTLEFTGLVWLGSLAAGFLGALTGLGGGVVIVPMLTFLLHFLCSSCSCTALSGSIRNGWVYLEARSNLNTQYFISIQNLPTVIPQKISIFRGGMPALVGMPQQISEPHFFQNAGLVIARAGVIKDKIINARGFAVVANENHRVLWHVYIAGIQKEEQVAGQYIFQSLSQKHGVIAAQLCSQRRYRKRRVA
jgi:hypothetical protein